MKPKAKAPQDNRNTEITRKKFSIKQRIFIGYSCDDLDLNAMLKTPSRLKSIYQNQTDDKFQEEIISRIGFNLVACVRSELSIALATRVDLFLEDTKKDLESLSTPKGMFEINHGLLEEHIQKVTKEFTSLVSSPKVLVQKESFSNDLFITMKYIEKILGKRKPVKFYGKNISTVRKNITRCFYHELAKAKALFKIKYPNGGMPYFDSFLLDKIFPQNKILKKVIGGKGSPMVKENDSGPKNYLASFHRNLNRHISQTKKKTEPR